MSKQLDIFDVFKQPDYLIYSEVFPDVESDEIEYKSAAGGFPKDFWRTYSAFANTNGGIIVLGVKEINGKFIFDGLDDTLIEKYKKDFWNNANNQSTISANLLSNHDVKVYSIESKKILAFNIPVADRKNKPVHLTTNPFKNTYKRNHEGDYVCRDEEVRRMLADADLSFSPDSRILEGYTLDDIDITTLKQYRQMFASIRPSHAWLTLEDIPFLEQLGAYRKDRRTKKEGFTLAGMVMFGKYLSIKDEECCPKFFPDYREILSENEDIRWSDRIYPDGTWECNLFQFYKLVYPKLISRLPKPFQLVQGQRQDETPAHTALREAFVNALIHTDYSAPGSIVIESHQDSFKFINPGTLLVSLHQFYKGGISQCRNTSLQGMFLMIGSAEKAGSGVSKIISGWTSALWRRPYVQVDTEPDRITLQMPMFSVIPDGTLTDLKEQFGESVEALGKDELTALAVCHIEGEVTNYKLQYNIDKHKSDITKMLQDLCKNNYLVSENKGRWTTYRLNLNFTKNVDSSQNEDANVDSSVMGILPEEISSLSGISVDNPMHADLKNVDTSNVDTSDVDGSNVDTSVDTNLYKKKSAIQQNIIDVCKDDYISVEEIAQKVDRAVKYLKNKVIPEMVKNGYLVKLFPQTNHPQQKYISKHN
jgi:predicted HTH transcriptional regulator